MTIRKGLNEVEKRGKRCNKFGGGMGSRNRLTQPSCGYC